MVRVVTAGITLVLVATAVYTDIRWGKIFNAVTVPAAGLGLILGVAGTGTAGLLVSLEGIAVALGLFLVSGFLGRILGGGDIKLLMAVGALQGPSFVLWTIVATAAAGAVLAIALALHKRILLSKVKSLVTGCYLRMAHRVPMRMEEDSAGPRLPYAVAIALGVIVSMAVLKP